MGLKQRNRQQVVMGLSSPRVYISKALVAKIGWGQLKPDLSSLVCMTKREQYGLLWHFPFGFQQGWLCNLDLSGLRLSVNIANPCFKL